MTGTARILVILAALGAAGAAQAGETFPSVRPTVNNYRPAETSQRALAPLALLRIEAVKNRDRAMAVIHADPLAKRFKMARRPQAASHSGACRDSDCDLPEPTRSSVRRATARGVEPASSAA